MQGRVTVAGCGFGSDPGALKPGSGSDSDSGSDSGSDASIYTVDS